MTTQLQFSTKRKTCLSPVQRFKTCRRMVSKIYHQKIWTDLFQLVYNDPRSTPSDDQSQDGSSYCPSLSPSSTKEILGQVGFLPVYGLPLVEGLLKKIITRTPAFECPGNIVTSWAWCTCRYMLMVNILVWPLCWPFLCWQDHSVTHVDHLQGDEVVAVEVKPATIEELLPPSLKQKKFGGSW